METLTAFIFGIATAIQAYILWHFFRHFEPCERYTFVMGASFGAYLIIALSRFGWLHV